MGRKPRSLKGMGAGERMDVHSIDAILAKHYQTTPQEDVSTFERQISGFSNLALVTMARWNFSNLNARAGIVIVNFVGVPPKSMSILRFNNPVIRLTDGKDQVALFGKVEGLNNDEEAEKKALYEVGIGNPNIKLIDKPKMPSDYYREAREQNVGVVLGDRNRKLMIDYLAEVIQEETDLYIL